MWNWFYAPYCSCRHIVFCQESLLCTETFTLLYSHCQVSLLLVCVWITPVWPLKVRFITVGTHTFISEYKMLHFSQGHRPGKILMKLARGFNERGFLVSWKTLQRDCSSTHCLRQVMSLYILKGYKYAPWE